MITPYELLTYFESSLSTECEQILVGHYDIIVGRYGDTLNMAELILTISQPSCSDSSDKSVKNYVIRLYGDGCKRTEHWNCASMIKN